MRLIRVFPRKTKATPTDELAYFGPPDLFTEADRVHVSVTFTWDKPAAERLADQWRHVAPVEVGGPAYGDPGGYFMTGKTRGEDCGDHAEGRQKLTVCLTPPGGRPSIEKNSGGVAQ
jgi:hypothetical protein